ncbi:hypothetical protein PN499_02345, partial [Kamptonema animale CS-326]|nr:hypothetical protein [Kamptonema animale CS-326]
LVPRVKMMAGDFLLNQIPTSHDKYFHSPSPKRFIIRDRAQSTHGRTRSDGDGSDRLDERGWLQLCISGRKQRYAL